MLLRNAKLHLGTGKVSKVTNYMYLRHVEVGCIRQDRSVYPYQSPLKGCIVYSGIKVCTWWVPINDQHVSEVRR